MKYKSIKQAKNKRFNELQNNIILNQCSNETNKLLTIFFKNVHYIFKRDKITYNKIIVYYASNGIRINKSYLYRLSKLKTYKTCNILILQFIANYLNIPLIELLTKQFYLNDNVKQVNIDDDIISF